jgi:hypothetical protein
MTMTDATDTLAEIRSIVEERKEDARSHETETLCETLLGVLEERPQDAAFASAPWTPERPDETGHAHVWASDGDLVATVCGAPVHGETAYERARLIAAATEMREALQKIANEDSTSRQRLKTALDALDAARGG